MFGEVRSFSQDQIGDCSSIRLERQESSRYTRTNYARNLKQFLAFLEIAPAELERLAAILPRSVALFARKKLDFASPHAHELCRSVDHLRSELTRIEALGGEGLMLREPGSSYVAGRSTTLLKVKSFQDAEAKVIGHQAGAGRHKGRLGALLVELPNKTRFSVGTGFSDAHREKPPPVGSTITFRFQELTDGGVPRFPSYIGTRVEVPAAASPPSPKGDRSMSSTSTPRRFEFTDGSSDKFWEIAVNGKEVTVCYGRRGTSGQTTTKEFPDGAAAEKHAETIVKQKLAKGYQPVR